MILPAAASRWFACLFAAAQPVVVEVPPATVIEASPDASAAAVTPSASTPILLWSDPAPPDAAAAWGARLRRVQAELELLGLPTLVVPAGASASTELAAQLQQHGAQLAIWVAGDRDRAELWRLDGRRLEQIAIVTGDEDDGTFAVRCAEVASALSLPVAHAQVQPLPRAEPIAPAPAPIPPPLRGDLRLSFALGGASRDLGLLLLPGIGGGVRLGRHRRLGLDGELAATALQGRVRGPAGVARVGWFVARAHVGVWPVPRARVSPLLGLGGGVLAAWTRGRASVPYRGRSDATAVGVVSALLDVAIRVAPRLRVRVGVRVAMALPALRIDTGAAPRRTGWPLGEGVLALEWLPSRR